MPNVTVVQLSDLHFGAGDQNVHPAHKLLEEVARVVGEQLNPVVLASGDITYQARETGFQEAKQFFERLLEMTGLPRDRFLFCPGNHDCHATKRFSDFDAFTYSIRRDNACTYSGETCRILEIDGLSFLLTNSSHHLDHRYGLADTKALREAAVADPSNCVAVIHHHLIPSDRNDPSTTRNAHDVLSALDSMGIPVLLHGHQHVAKGMRIGATPISVFGVNSFNFHMRGAQNAIGVLAWRDDGVKFSRHVLLADSIRSSASGFALMEEVQVR